MPHREVMDGVLVIFGGAFLITPGFITDILGVLLLLPPTRAVDPAAADRAGSAAGVTVGRPAAARPRRDFDVEGTATEHDAAARAARAVSAPALAVRLLRPRPRALRDGAVGGHAAVRGPQAGRARARARAIEPEGERLARRAGRTRSRSSSSPSRRRPTSDGVTRTRLPRDRRGRPAREVDCLGTVAETHRAPALGGARRCCAASRRWSTTSNALLALARRPRGAPGHGDERVHRRLLEDGELRRRRGRAHLHRLRRRRSPAQRRPGAVAARRGVSRAAAPGW